MRKKERVSAMFLACALAVGTATTSQAVPVLTNNVSVNSSTTPGDVTKVRWGWRGHWRGPVIGGVILGGAIAAPYYYGYPYAYGYYPYGSSSICFEGIWRRQVPCNLP
jgi:hypothetical protein